MRTRSHEADRAATRARAGAGGSVHAAWASWIWLRGHAEALAWRVGRAALAVFAATFVFYLAVGLILIAQLGITGDEPWYLMLGYSLVHNHTANLAPIVNNPPLYHTFLSHWDDHTKDFLGNGERVLPNLPGYSLILGVCTLLAGRVGIVVLQAWATALTATLLFIEGQRIFAARAAGLFACAAFAFALPATVYVSQMFPSALASSAAFAGFVLATRALPAATGRRRQLAAVGLAILCALLPWLHFKYALVALALVGLALIRLLGVPIRSLLGGRTTPLQVWRTADRSARRAALIVVGINAASFLLIAVYCRHYFGTWTPQYSSAAGSAMDFLHPDLPRTLTLYTDMFASNQSGLLPWVPLDLLVIPGAVLLWRRSPAQARAVLLLIAAQLAGFLPVLFTPAIYQGFALPSRFTVECAPFFALCVTGVFAAGWPSLRDEWRALLAHTSSAQRRAPGFARRIMPSMPHPPSSVASRHDRVRRRLAALAAGGALVLWLAGGWFIVVALPSPGLLYASHSGNRIAEMDSTFVPGWWFAAFPDPGHTITYHLTLGLTPDAPPKLPATTVSVSGREELPPGEYSATFTWTCALTPTGETTTNLELRVEQVNDAHPVLAARQIPASVCNGQPQTQIIPRFSTDGYDPTRFRITAPSGVTFSAVSVSYGPSHTGANER